MAKVKKFAMGGMNLNRSSRRPPPQPVRPPPQAGQPVRAVPVQTPNTSGTPAGLANLQRAIQNPSQSSMGSGPMPVARQSLQSPNTSGAPAGLGAMGGGLSEAQLSGLRNNLGPQSVPANIGVELNRLHTGMGARPSSVGGFSSPAGQPVQAPNTSGAPAGLGAMSGMKKGGTVKSSTKSSASKRGDGIAQRGKTRGKIV